jgi:dihydrofolate reductase
MPRLSLIVALGTRTRAIGKNNALLWHLKGDLPRFKALTFGHPLIMGFNTFQSIGKPLPGRTNIVLTHDTTWSHDGVQVCHSFDEAIQFADSLDTDEVFVIGGGVVYAHALPYADRLYLTLVDDDTEGDTFFPDYTKLPFVEISRETHGETLPHFAWVLMERIRDTT